VPRTDTFLPSTAEQPSWFVRSKGDFTIRPYNPAPDEGRTAIMRECGDWEVSALTPMDVVRLSCGNTRDAHSTSRAELTGTGNATVDGAR
jgi:hypothetical protein